MSKKLRKEIKYNVLFLLVKFLIWLSEIFPRNWVVSFYGTLGRLAYKFAKKSKRRTIKHLTMAFGKEKSKEEIHQMAAEVYENIGKNFADIVRLLSVKSLEKFEKVVDTEGEEHLEKAYKKGKGVICLTCHLGAFELTGTNVALRNYPTFVIGTRMKDPKLDGLLVKNRTSRGIENIYRGEDTIKLIRGLKTGKVVCILIDQDTKVKSTFVDFFGIPAKTPIGATLLALKTDAAIVPMAATLGKDGRQKVVFKPEIEVVKTGDYDKDLVTNTALFSKALEDFIRESPTQWVWMHERWKHRPEGEEVNPNDIEVSY
ncbi:lysophospholipid acyltransferase family protein [Chondrinema litorale]|uniref:lysophospholipid acyltransferase family protein n=1 Tax=Chondrinema litorale TaxID=2994555 RepID=UPI0025439A88|nr:lysophospholipid acyltransferase family protein [Chondrinema litorale]UZR95017.1 lysophospholipid acyltransferase family protein [Chondrinema litorale]